MPPAPLPLVLAALTWLVSLTPPLPAASLLPSLLPARSSLLFDCASGDPTAFAIDAQRILPPSAPCLFCSYASIHPTPCIVTSFQPRLCSIDSQQSRSACLRSPCPLLLSLCSPHRWSFSLAGATRSQPAVAVVQAHPHVRRFARVAAETRVADSPAWRQLHCPRDASANFELEVEQRRRSPKNAQIHGAFISERWEFDAEARQRGKRSQRRQHAVDQCGCALRCLAHRHAHGADPFVSRSSAAHLRRGAAGS